MGKRGIEGLRVGKRGRGRNKGRVKSGEKWRGGVKGELRDTDGHKREGKGYGTFTKYLFT